MPDTQEHISIITSWLAEHIGDHHVVLGMSGGIDSAVVGFLLKRVVPADRVHILIMPSAVSESSDMTDAKQVADAVSSDVRQIELQPIINAYESALPEFSTNDKAKMNLHPRIRMSLLYGIANSIDGLVIGTGNKSELLAGYFTKYGDGGVDLLPIADLYKHQVYNIASELGVPEHIIAKAPSANLYPGQTDEQEMGISYPTLDAILQILHQPNAGVAVTQYAAKDVERVQQLQNASEHKRRPVPICHIPV